MAEALKACPFCGCEKIVKSEYAPTREMTLFCSTCRAGVTRQRGSTETVWAARNRRPPVADAGSVGDISSLIAARCSALPGALIDCPVCGAVDKERARLAVAESVLRIRAEVIDCLREENAGLRRQRDELHETTNRYLARARAVEAKSVGGAEPVAWISDTGRLFRAPMVKHGEAGFTPLFAAPPALGGWKPDREAVANVADDLRAISNDMANAKVPESLWRPVYERALALEALLPVSPPIAAAPKAEEA